MNASELQALDAEVAKLTGSMHLWHRFEPSTDWACGGPIIERERIAITCHAWGGGAFLPPGAEAWIAHTLGALPVAGPTPLIAAMRAFVASKEKP